jgi:hypothetical protein
MQRETLSKKVTAGLGNFSSGARCCDTGDQQKDCIDIGVESLERSKHRRVTSVTFSMEEQAVPGRWLIVKSRSPSPLAWFCRADECQTGRFYADLRLDLRNQIWRAARFGAPWRQRNANTVAEPKGFGRQIPRRKDSIAALDLHDAIIDGEIVALDEKGRSSFQLLQGIDMGHERPTIVSYTFDLIQLNGKVLQKPQSRDNRNRSMKRVCLSPPKLS